MTREPSKGGPTLAEAFAAEELAPPPPSPAPSAAVTRPRRNPGTTNAPGGAWFSTPKDRRKSKPKTLTLSPRATVALAALKARPGGDSESAEASAAIIERALRLGLDVPAADE